MNIYVFLFCYISKNIKRIHGMSECENSKALYLPSKLKGQGAISMIKQSKGTIKLEIFNLLNSIDHLFIPFSFHMIAHR